ncbi:MAG: hypothetical protein KJ675_10805, partial [Gammaproteobacteria bacterium]|nr:hypothetical protein [Gammaproteobacteria bacterium]
MEADFLRFLLFIGGVLFVLGIYFWDRQKRLNDHIGPIHRSPQREQEEQTAARRPGFEPLWRQEGRRAAAPDEGEELDDSDDILPKLAGQGEIPEEIFPDFHPSPTTFSRTARDEPLTEETEGLPPLQCDASEPENIEAELEQLDQTVREDPHDHGLSPKRAAQDPFFDLLIGEEEESEERLFEEMTHFVERDKSLSPSAAEGSSPSRNMPSIRIPAVTGLAPGRTHVPPVEGPPLAAGSEPFEEAPEPVAAIRPEVPFEIEAEEGPVIDGAEIDRLWEQGFEEGSRQEPDMDLSSLAFGPEREPEPWLDSEGPLDLDGGPGFKRVPEVDAGLELQPEPEPEP